jgi:hypothetical protein
VNNRNCFTTNAAIRSFFELMWLGPNPERWMMEALMAAVTPKEIFKAAADEKLKANLSRG